MKSRFAALLILLAGPAAAAAGQPASESDALELVTKELCHRQVAVLGEAEHGDARTEAFKVALIERLVSRCGYAAVLFEASFYEFVQLDRVARSGRPLTPDQIGTAVGGLWKFNREFQPLLPYLAQQANAGKVRLGGVDFQQGGREQDYTNFGVVAELTAELPGEARERCRTVFRDLLFKGSNPARRTAATACTAEVAALAPSADPDVRRERREMLANLGAYAATDPAQQNNYVARRDSEMYANFRRWMARWPVGTKVIVWTATSHAARAPHRHKRFEGVQPFGAYLARRYGQRVYALGFAAQGGTTRGTPTPRVIASAAPASLEAQAGEIAPDGARFLGRAALSRAGAREGGLFSHYPIVADWSQLLDGVIVFPRETHPADIRKGD